MKKILLAAAALAALAACSQPQQPAAPAGPPTAVEITAPSGEYTIDPNHTNVSVRALHFGLSHYTLRLTNVAGTLNFDAANPTASTLTATVKTDSVETEYKGDRDFNAELANSDWLNAAQFPDATFTSTSVELTGPNTGKVNGDLTIRGVTHPLTLDVTFNNGYAQHPMGFPIALLGFSAHGTFKRSDYGLNVLLPPAGSNVGVSDEVELVIETEFTRPNAPAAPAPAN